MSLSEEINESGKESGNASAMNENGNGPTLEAMLQEIEETIAKMDSPEISLEESFHAYEKGIRMIREANHKIDLVEKQMVILQQEAEEAGE